MNMKRSSA
jgi:NIMA (never in mitosis gene a)-related kinase 1/4/5